MKDNKKNIVVIMTDQQKADVRALEGYPLDTIPFLDTLAKKGVWFDKAYTTMAVCGPARTSLLTGRWPSAHRVSGNFCLEQAVFDKDMFDVAKEQGYRTALIGKNHSYLNPKKKLDFNLEYDHWGGFGPNRSEDEKSYDQWLKTISQVSLEPTPFPLECQLPYRAVTAAQEWVKQVEDRPFLMWLSFPEPHNPYQAPEPYYSMFPPHDLPPLKAKEQERIQKGDKWTFYGKQIEHFMPDYKERIPRARTNYMGMLRLIDDQIRRFIQFLDDEALMEQTLIVFMSDHGDFVGEYELLKKGPELPDILTRIPFQFYGAGVKSNSQPHPAHVSLADVMPTLCEVMGASIPTGVQGRSLWPLLTGEAYPEKEFASVFAEHGYGGLYHVDGDSPQFDLVGSVTNGVIKYNELNKYTQSGWMRTLRKENWKINMDMYGKVELYDIIKDPLELVNCYGREEFKDVEHEMLADLCTWMIRMQAPTLATSKEYPLKVGPHNYLFM